jgi:hypothetical protein
MFACQIYQQFFSLDLLFAFTFFASIDSACSSGTADGDGRYTRGCKGIKPQSMFLSSI